PLLQSLDLHGDGGLRLVHAPGGLGEAAAIGDRAKGLQLVQIQGRRHHKPPSRMLMSGMKFIRWTNRKQEPTFMNIGDRRSLTARSSPPGKPRILEKNHGF